MKVLWVEDHHRAQEMLMVAATKAVRKRLQLDLVIAASLMEAERRLRFEQFDLVVLDLRLPDSIDETMTLTRIASMGRFRMAVVSASENRDAVAKAAIAAGCDCAPVAVAKETLPFNRFIQRPEEFFQFLQSLTRQPEPQAA
ncbi:MAG: response regulator receiver protein [Ponticaulis sp.]|nr:response regulator receiver protein [Ponticaulis sp.]|tara:strand:- start:28097 stop:28522 length:426 start_codon:yes stop_codon:yes gene_type:complete